VNVPACPVGAEITALPLLEETTWPGTPFTVYSKLYGPTLFPPFNVISGEFPFTHTRALPLMLAVGAGMV